MSTIPRVFGHICIKSIKHEKECSTVGASPLAFRWSFAKVYFSLSSYAKVGEGGNEGGREGSMYKEQLCSYNFCLAAKTDQVNKAKEIIKKLTFPFDSSCFENPCEYCIPCVCLPSQSVTETQKPINLCTPLECI